MALRCVIVSSPEGFSLLICHALYDIGNNQWCNMIDGSARLFSSKNLAAVKSRRYFLVLLSAHKDGWERSREGAGAATQKRGLLCN